MWAGLLLSSCSEEKGPASYSQRRGREGGGHTHTHGVDRFSVGNIYTYTGAVKTALHLFIIIHERTFYVLTCLKFQLVAHTPSHPPHPHTHTHPAHFIREVVVRAVRHHLSSALRENPITSSHVLVTSLCKHTFLCLPQSFVGEVVPLENVYRE